jgi:23S rRNA (guanosine2251-2'-O)-methyltransferase
LSNFQQITVIGRHSVEEFLDQSPELIESLYLGPKPLEAFSDHKKYPHFLGKVFPIKQLALRPQDEDAADQGFVAKVRLPIYSAQDLPQLLEGEKSCLILDHLLDPHNVGACIRSACAFGVRVILMPKHASCQVTSTVAKVAAGGLARVKIVMGNLGQMVRQLKDIGFWVAATSEHGQTLELSQLSGSIAWIVGNEQKGVSESLLKSSDWVFSLPTQADFPSLNVSVATGIVLYLSSQNR